MRAWNGGPSSSGSSSHGISAGLFPRPASNMPVIWDRMNLNDRVFSVLGSNYNRAPFRLIPRTINNMKGKVFALQQPFDLPTWLTRVREAAEDDIGEEDWLEPLREVVSIWRYLWSPGVLPSIQRQRRQMRQQMTAASVSLTGFNNLADIWEDFDINYWYTTAQHTREFLRNAVQRAAGVYERDPADRPSNWDRVIAQLDEIIYQMEQWVLELPGAGPAQTGDNTKRKRTAHVYGDIEGDVLVLVEDEERDVNGTPGFAIKRDTEEVPDLAEMFEYMQIS